MENVMFVLCVILLVPINLIQGLENNKQRFNTNLDFLRHEAGAITSNNDFKQSLTNGNIQQVSKNQNDFDQFPPLKSPSSNVGSTNQPVVSTTPTKRDYVNPNYPPLKPQSQSVISKDKTTTISVTTGTTPSPRKTTSGRRDYVNPNYPPLNNRGQDHNNQNRGNVKDIINFYENKGKDNTHGPSTISYSSVVQSGNNKLHNPSSTTKQSVTQQTTKPTPLPTKQPSFSSVVSGNKNNVITTSKPTLRPNPNKVASTPRPSTILPSTVLNNKKNGDQSKNAPSDQELQSLSEELLRKDSNNAAKYITINYQEKTTSQSKEDKAPLPLLTIPPEVWNISTIQKFVPLLDNYERDTLVNEYVTPQERNEENAFMDAIMVTPVIRHLMNFLKQKGYVSPDPRQQRDFLKQLWFTLYSRGKGKLSSSGFEHVFVSELKDGGVLGLHNWIYFYREEEARRANYLGYLKYLTFNDKGAVLKLHFVQQGADKPVDTMLIGTSPELEIALYTLCFVTRADNDCNLKLANKDVNIVTYTFRYRSKNLIGSAFPQI